ncbi:hypothetical protein LXL04_018828 [Taraxacum kok-saghyz]
MGSVSTISLAMGSWVYKIKYKSTGEVDRYKARLVAKGYNQKEGVDFDETFSPVAKLVTVRCIINIAINCKWNLYQLDVNNAFLYGTIDEEVYMTPPPGYFTEKDTKVCKLVKSLYGLKQAPRKWNEKLNSFFIEFGFIQSKNDYSLYTFNKRNCFIILLVYVDDIILTGDSEVEIESVKSFLKSKFRIKDLGILKFFLGNEIVNCESGVCLCQRKYFLELLHEYGMIGCKPAVTLLLKINDHHGISPPTPTSKGASPRPSNAKSSSGAATANVNRSENSRRSLDGNAYKSPTNRREASFRHSISHAEDEFLGQWRLEDLDPCGWKGIKDLKIPVYVCIQTPMLLIPLVVNQSWECSNEEQINSNDIYGSNSRCKCQTFPDVDYTRKNYDTHIGCRKCVS